MTDSPEGKRVSDYLHTVGQMEPDISPVDLHASQTSIAISMKRIADQLERLVDLAEPLAKAGKFGIEQDMAENPDYWQGHT